MCHCDGVFAPFCGECVLKCLRLGKKECPTCRIHIPSRRSLRPDPNFDKLIQKNYGNIDVLEKVEEHEIKTLNKLKNMNNAYAESCKLGIMQQAISRKKTNNKGMSFKPNNKQLSGTKRKHTGPPVIHDLEVRIITNIYIYIYIIHLLLLFVTN